MNRREFLRGTAVGAAGLLAGCATESLQPTSFDLAEATIADLRKSRRSAVALVELYFERIERIDRSGPALNSIIELNPDAGAIARSVDSRAVKGPVGPLHGIPVLIKDNLATHDRMTTTAGSLALLGSIPPRDSTVVRNLRAAGAVILGKTNLSEWANFRGSGSSSGWSGRGGLTKNPYVLDRNPSGSSSGSAVAVSAGLCAVAVGTETDGSIVSPSSICGIVGIKPTVGLISRTGIIPIAHSQDTAGPMARTVTDAAILLGAMVGEDPEDPATEASRGRYHRDYTTFLDADGLKGARIGVARKFFRSGSISDKLLDSAIAAMKARGAEIVDPSDLPSLGKLGDAEMQVLLYEFKADLNAYLASLGPDAPVHSLREVIEFNERNKERELRWFGQETMVRAQEKGPLTDKPYTDALEKCRRLMRTEGIDMVMDQHRLDAIVAPTTGPAGKTDLIYGERSGGGSSGPAAVAGYPGITLPMGEAFGLPVGISFFGRAWSEPALLKLAFAFEQATKARRTPRFIPSIG